MLELGLEAQKGPVARRRLAGRRRCRPASPSSNPTSTTPIRLIKCRTRRPDQRRNPVPEPHELRADPARHRQRHRGRRRSPAPDPGHRPRRRRLRRLSGVNLVDPAGDQDRRRARGGGADHQQHRRDRDDQRRPRPDQRVVAAAAHRMATPGRRCWPSRSIRQNAQILGAQRRRDQALSDLNTHRRQIEHVAGDQGLPARQVHRPRSLPVPAAGDAARSTAGRTTWPCTPPGRRSGPSTSSAATPPAASSRTAAGTTCGRGCWPASVCPASLRHMEKAYLDENVREYELTKHFSLRLHFPLEFLRLRTTGRCEIEIPEWMFDLETPGMYMRRIKSVCADDPLRHRALHGRALPADAARQHDAYRPDAAAARARVLLPAGTVLRRLRATPSAERASTSSARTIRGPCASTTPARRSPPRSGQNDSGLVPAQLRRPALPAVRVHGRGEPLAHRAAAREQLLRLATR